MLPSGNRMRRRTDFSTAVRNGRRAGRSHVVSHLLCRNDDESPPLVGFVVGRPVGIAVVRNRVRRRLRALVAERLDELPRGSLLVVRANPRAAAAAYTELAADLDATLSKLSRSGRREEGPV